MGTPETLVAPRKRQLVAKLHDRRKWLQRHRILFFSPLQYQAPFFGSPAHTRLVYGSNRSGKTVVGVVEDISFALGFRPWLLPRDMKERGIKWILENFNLIPPEALTPLRPPVKVLILEDDWDTADDILITGTIDRAGKLTHYIPPDALRGSPQKNTLGYFYEWNLVNGSIIRIETEKSFVNNPGSFEGGVWDLVHYDEPKKRELRVALKRGLVDRHGYEIFTLTPLAEPWIKDQLYDQAGTNPDIDAFFFDTEQNPYISREGWESFKASLDETEKEARVAGKWVHLRGLVYPEFVPRPVQQDGHLVKPLSHEWLSKNATLYASIDPHARQPHACLLLAADREGRLICWDEVFVKALLPEFCDLIKSKLLYKLSTGRTEALPVVRWFCDPLAFEEDPIDGHTWADEFIDQGLYVEKAPKRRAQGILDVRQAFKEKRLLVGENCHRLIYELQHYVYEEWRGKGRNEKEKPMDRDDHLVECLYRLVLIRPLFVDPEAETAPIEPKRSWCP